METIIKSKNIEILLTSKFYFGYSIVKGCNINALTNNLSLWKNDTQSFMHNNKAKIESNIQAYVDFFEQNGYKCPLKHQFNTTLSKGFNIINPFVDMLLINELRHGILMGVQDFDKIEGRLSISLSEKDDNFKGMFKTIECKQNDIIIRDEESIIASYFQGPDKKTMVSDSTKNVIFFIFSIPSTSYFQIEEALDYIKEKFNSLADSIESKII